MGSDSDRHLPRLVYVGDAPVEAGMGGSALIYRLLCEYPPDRLLVMQGREGNALRRLSGVRYVIGTPIRNVPSRLPGLHAILSMARAYIAADALATHVKGFQADAVVTVAYECGWVTAWRVAQRLRLPLHIICHDDWEPTVPVPRALRGWARGCFARAYRYATTRFCVSPRMAAHYEQQLGVPGRVLYPGRAKDAVAPMGPPGPRESNTFTVAHAGSVHAAYAPALRALAAALASIGGRLLLISNLSPSTADELGLVAPTVRLEKAMDAAALVPYLRSHVDALFLVTTDVGLNTRIAFPSKLVDYTAAALPVIISAPDESAPAYWARENPSAAILVDIGNETGLRDAVVALAKDPERRRVLGRQSQAAGAPFDYGRIRDTFLQALAPAVPPSSAGMPYRGATECVQSAVEK